VSDCLVCQEVAAQYPVPGGLLWEDELAVAFHIPPIEGNERPYLGHLLVVTRRHVDHLGDLTDPEAASVHRASRQLGAALRAEGAERVHVAVIGLGMEHFHQHLYPRYPGVPEGTNWMGVGELQDAPHGGAAEIEKLGARLRQRLQGQRAG